MKLPKIALMIGLLMLGLAGCTTTGRDVVVYGQHGERMVIPNGGMPGMKGIIGAIKGLKYLKP